MKSEYDDVTELEWAEYSFATIEYDYRIHPDAAKAIRFIFERLYHDASERPCRAPEAEEKE